MRPNRAIRLTSFLLHENMIAYLKYPRKNDVAHTRSLISINNQQEFQKNRISGFRRKILRLISKPRYKWNPSFTIDLITKSSTGRRRLMNHFKLSKWWNNPWTLFLNAVELFLRERHITGFVLNRQDFGPFIKTLFCTLFRSYIPRESCMQSMTNWINNTLKSKTIEVMLR